MAQLNVKTRVLEASIGVLGVPSEVAASTLRELELLWRDERSETPGTVIPFRARPAEDDANGGADGVVEDVVGFDYVPRQELRFARRTEQRDELRDCELRICLRATVESAEPGAARRVAELADGFLVLVDPTAPAAEVEQLLAELARGDRRDRPVVTWSQGNDDQVLDVVERLVERTLLARDAEPAPPSKAPTANGHPLLDSLRAILVEVADDHMRRVEASLGERLAARIEARLAEVADGKRLAEIDKRVARVAAEVTGRASAESKWRADESTRAITTLERVETVHHLLSEMDPDVSEMRTGMVELGSALRTVAGTLETLVRAVEASATRGEARAKRVDAVAAVLGAHGETMRDLEERHAELAKGITKVEEQVRAARADLATVSKRTVELSSASAEKLDRIREGIRADLVEGIRENLEEGLSELRRERATRDPETVELLREVTDLCEEIKKKKKGWFG